MIKECNVISWNVINMVVDFEGNIVQMPSTEKKERIVFIKYDNKNYFLSSKEEYEKYLSKNVKKEVVKEIN